MTVLAFPVVCSYCHSAIRDRGDLKAISVVRDGVHYHASCFVAVREDEEGVGS